MHYIFVILTTAFAGGYIAADLLDCEHLKWEWAMKSVMYTVVIGVSLTVLVFLGVFLTSK